MRRFLAGVCALAFVASIAPAFAQDQETPEMKKHNEQFRKKEEARPASEKDYRNTKQYKAQSPEQQKETDKTVERANKGVETIKSERAKGQTKSDSGSTSSGSSKAKGGGAAAAR
jgi:hypothetical protein